MAGKVQLSPEKDNKEPRTLSISGDSALDYDERILKVGGDGQVEKTARVYQRMDFQRKVGDRAQKSSLRPEVRRLVVLRNKNVEVPFSPDGPLTWGEIDLVRTDVFPPALEGLLPDRPVKTGDRWKAALPAVLELTDMEHIEAGEMECVLDQVVALEQRRHAKVSLSGTLRGINEDGPNQQKLTGYFYFDLESNHLSYLYLKGTHTLLDKNGKELGHIDGRFVLTRQINQHCKELSDEALKPLKLEPTAENTLLLFDDVGLGIRFLYPRRWRVAGGAGRQVTLDSADGSGLLLTLEPPEQVPSGAQFLAETRDWLVGQKARILNKPIVQRVQDAPRELEHFKVEVEMAGQRVVMAYYVVRQARGGATLAARLLPRDLDALDKEVGALAKSIVIARPAFLKDEREGKKQ
jgi:hypothetical protein